MTCWLSRRRARGWALVAISLGLAVLGVVLSHVYRWNRAPWRSFRAGDRQSALARGREYLQQGFPRRAIQAVSRVRDDAPEAAEALTIRGMAWASLEEVGPARQALERAWRLRPNAMAAKVLAAIYLASNETDRGLRMLQAAARLVPDDFRPWYAMGESVHMQRRKYEDAIVAFRESLKRLPDHLESRVGLIDALIKAHRGEEAEPLLQILFGERPDDPKVLVLASALALEGGRDDEAERYFQRIFAVGPDHREALLLQAHAQFRKHRPSQALPGALKALAIAPNDLEALNLLGSIQSALGMKEEAAATLAPPPG